MPEDTGGQATTPEEGSLDLDSALAEAIGGAEAQPGAEESNTEVEVEDPEAQGAEERPAQDGEKYTVKVGGEEIEVTLDELLNGHMRHADYTRKTQELAREGQALEAYKQLDAAFQEDPLGTLNQIARSLGLEEQFGQAPDNQTDSGLDPDDPIAKELRDLREWQRNVNADMAARQAAERAAAVDRELEAVKVKYQVPDLDTDALLQHAVDNRIPSLEAAYRDMNFEVAQAPPKKVASKRTLPPVEGGRNRNVGVGPKKNDSPSWDEAFSEAWQEVA